MKTDNQNQEPKLQSKLKYQHGLKSYWVISVALIIVILIITFNLSFKLKIESHFPPIKQTMSAIRVVLAESHLLSDEITIEWDNSLETQLRETIGKIEWNYNSLLNGYENSDINIEPMANPEALKLLEISRDKFRIFKQNIFEQLENSGVAGFYSHDHKKHNLQYREIISGLKEVENIIDKDHKNSEIIFRIVQSVLFFSLITLIIWAIYQVKIEDKKRTLSEEYIKQQAELFEELFENAPVAFQTIDTNGNILTVNRNWLQQTGYLKEEVVGRNFGDFLIDKEKTFFQNRFEKVLKLGHVPPTNYHLVRKDGKVILTSHVGKISHATNSVLCAFQDVTLQKEYENTIRDQNYFLNTILESLDHPFYVVNAKDYSIELANSKARKLNPFASNCYSLGHKVDTPCWEHGENCPLQQIKKTGKPVIFEHVHYDGDGIPFYVEVHGYPIFDVDGKISRIIEYTLNITERKLAEEALINSEMKFRQLAENIDEIFWLRTKDTIEYISPAYERIYGKSCQSLYTSPFSYTDSIHPEDLAVKEKYIEDDVFFSNNIESDVFRIVRPDNTHRWIWSRSFPISDVNNKVIKRAGIAIDITDQKRQDEIMHNVVKGISSASGKKFFEDIVFYLGKALGADYTLIGEFAKDNDALINTTAFYAKGKIEMNFSFAMAGTPCSNVLNNESCLYSKDVTEIFPEDLLLREMNVKAFIGIPLFNMDNLPIGLLAGFYEREVPDIASYENILQIFATRAATEIDRLKAERELSKSEWKYRSLFKNMLDAFAYHKIIVDDSGKPVDYVFLETNEAFHEMLNLKREDVIGKKVTEIIPGIENDNTDWIGIYGEVALKGTVRRMEQYSDALKKWYSIAIYCPELGYFATLFEDITKRKKAEEAIKEIDRGISSQLGEKFFESMVLHISLMLRSSYTFIGELLEDGKTLATISFCKENKIINNVSFLITGTPCEAVIANGSLIIASDFRENYEKCKINFEGEINSFVGIALKDKNNNPIGLIASLFNYKMDDFEFAESIQKIFAVRTATELQRRKIEREIENYRLHLEKLVLERTEQLEKEIEKQKDAERTVQLALKKEKELSELKSRFISITSHEFRTPLATIMSSTELIARYGQNWDDKTRNSQIDKITRSVDYLTELLEDVLIISRTETGKIKFNPSDVNLRLLCDSIVEDFRQHLKPGQKIDFTYSCSKDIYYLDEKLLKQILLNLISNGIKYSGESAMLKFVIEENNESLQIVIEDNGIGIPDEDKKYLFQPFHRGKNVADISGTGLGLSIVYKSVELCGGNIYCESKINKGTTFKISLPVQS